MVKKVKSFRRESNVERKKGILETQENSSPFPKCNKIMEFNTFNLALNILQNLPTLSNLSNFVSVPFPKRFFSTNHVTYDTECFFYVKPYARAMRNSNEKTRPLISWHSPI
jgi:hypothetical protein